ncbi:MAG: MarR family transcriptional regulator [Betaproteobacteria bacterium]|jgi:transcriptional regulator, MarR family|nr:MarR family transcriptional regulator [Betaproteobacteria bacterium]
MPTTEPSDRRFLPTLRELVRTYQTFDSVSSEHIRSLGLTTSQFDVIATLGNTNGLNCRDIGDKTLMVKGTLTGVLDRLERRGLIHRTPHPDDGRSTLVQLSDAGQRLFEKIFPEHLAFLTQTFTLLSDEFLTDLQHQLTTFRQALIQNNPNNHHDDN